MIEVIIYEEDNQLVAFEISGHANSGPYGYDLVCAGVSAVSFGAVNAVFELCEIDLEVDQAGEGGYLHVSIPTKYPLAQRQKAQLIFEAMIVSLQTIEREYSKFIKIQRK